MEFIFVILDYLKFNVENNYYLTIFCFFIFLLIYNTFAIPGNIIFISASGFFFWNIYWLFNFYNIISFWKFNIY